MDKDDYIDAMTREIKEKLDSTSVPLVADDHFECGFFAEQK